MTSIGADTSDAQRTQMPSELYNTQNPGVGEPTMVNTPTQQGATQPGSGSTTAPGETHQNEVPFKDQVFGYAKSIRGTVLRKPETKKTGEAILAGDLSAKEYFEQKKSSNNSD